MRRRRYRNIIYGKAYIDDNCSSVYDNSKQLLEGVGISLFLAEDTKKDIRTAQEKNISVIKERLVAKTKTNSKGEYSFFVDKGKYCVVADIETLPDGKGLTQASSLIDVEKNERVDFGARAVGSIEFGNNLNRNISVDEEFYISPVIKDISGNILSAKVQYASDSDDVELNSHRCKLRAGSLNGKSVNISAKSGDVKSQHKINFYVPELNHLDKIDIAYRTGILDEKNRIMYLLYSLFDKKSLPDEYRSNIPVKCGTPAVEEIQKYILDINSDKQVVEEAKRYVSASVPSLDKVYRSPSGYFKIHYTLTGGNAAAFRERNSGIVPLYVQQIGMAFDNVKAVICDKRGFKNPILDNGKDAMDVYVYDLKGTYGITYTSNYYDDKNTNTRVASSYICIDNSYSGEKGFKKNREECMKVTAAHEFFHAVQNAYNVDANTWWKEASATWNEDEVYYGINDYVRYLNSYFSAPQKSLDENSYSGVIFAKYLSENLGGYNVIKRIWETQGIKYSNSIKAIDNTIKDSNKEQNLAAVFNDFTACNFNPDQYYKDGSSWKASIALQNIYSEYPVENGGGRLNHLASNYQLFKSVQSAEKKSIRIVIDGTEGVQWGFKLQSRKKNTENCSIIEIASSNIFSRAEIIIYDFNENYDEICLIPSNLEKNRDNVIYKFSVNLQ